MITRTRYTESVTILNIIAWALTSPRRIDRFRPSARDPERRDDVARLVACADRILLTKVLGKLIFRTRCLKRTYVLYRLLRAHGHNATAHIGFDKTSGHAWLTVDGKRIPDALTPPTRPFAAFIEIGDEVRYLRG